MAEKYEFIQTDYGTRIKAYDTVCVAYIVMGGSGFNKIILEKGEEWTEGPDELFGVYENAEEADREIEEYLNNL